MVIGETSVQHTFQKLSIIQSVINSIKPFGSNTILLVVANPIDLFTSVIRDYSGLPATRVIGSGTWLDSIRMSNILAEKAGVSTNLTCECGISHSARSRPVRSTSLSWAFTGIQRLWPGLLQQYMIHLWIKHSHRRL